MEFVMMGYQSNLQPKLLCYNANLEKRIPPNHILRKIKEKIDFHFIYAEAKDSYGETVMLQYRLPLFLK